LREGEKSVFAFKLYGDPVAYIRRATGKLDALRFARSEKTNHIDVYQTDFA
jgi:hypothetical protein